MVSFVDRTQIVNNLRTTGRPHNEVLSVLRAHGVLKRNRIPNTLDELKPDDIRSYATHDRIRRVYLDLEQALPTPHIPTTLEGLFDSTVWALRDRHVHNKFSYLRPRIATSLVLVASIPEANRENVLTALSGTAAQVFANFLDISAGWHTITGATGSKALAMNLRLQGIFQDASRIKTAERAAYDSMAQDGKTIDSTIDALLQVENVKKQADIGGLLRVLRNSQTLAANGTLIRELELSLYSIKAYYSAQESKELGLVVSSLFAATYMGFLIGFRVNNFLDQKSLTISFFAAILLLWPELSSYFDTMVNRFFTAYGVRKLKGGHGQAHLPKQISRLKDIPSHEAKITHVTHTYQEAPSVCYRHLVYASRNADPNSTVVFWDASVQSYFIYGARGSIELTKARLSLQGLILGALHDLVPGLNREKSEDLAKRMSDIDPELDDSEMNHIYFENMVLDIGRDELGIGNRKIKLFAMHVSPLMLAASNPDQWNAHISIAGLRNLAVHRFGISHEKAGILARRVHEKGLHAVRRAEITRLSSEIIEREDTNNQTILAKLISEEYGIALDAATTLLGNLIAERVQAISLAYDEVMPIGKLFSSPQGRTLFADIYKFMEKTKIEQEKGGEIEVLIPEIFRQLIDKALFVEAKDGISRILRNALSRQELTMQMASEITKEIDGLEPKMHLYDQVNEEVGIREDVLTCEYMDAERRVYNRKMQQIASVVDRVSRKHNLSPEDIKSIKDAILNDWFWQNYWIEARTVAIGLANEVCSGSQNIDHAKSISARDVPRSSVTKEMLKKLAKKQDLVWNALISDGYIIALDGEFYLHDKFYDVRATKKIELHGVTLSKEEILELIGAFQKRQNLGLYTSLFGQSGFIGRAQAIIGGAV